MACGIVIGKSSEVIVMPLNSQMFRGILFARVAIWWNS